MANFDYSIKAESAIRVYDNQGAYNTLLEMMKRNEQLTVKLYSGKDNVPCAWIESRSVAGFKYQLKSSSFQGLVNYLFEGIVNDFDKNPKEADTIQEGEDFQYGDALACEGFGGGEICPCRWPLWCEACH